MTEQILDAVFINCDCDETQLTVQGTPGQTKPLQEWRNSEGESLARITATGALETAGLDFSEGTVEAAAGAFESLTADAGEFESLSADNVDINGGNIDGTVIGAAQATIGQFSSLGINHAAGTDRMLTFLSASQLRWLISVSAEAEGGANSGSNFYITRYGDNGAYLSSPLSINRVTGFINISNSVGLGATFAGTNATNTLVIADGDAPTSSPAGAVQLFADNVSGTIELRVRDSAGNVSTQSPHNPQIVDASNRISDWVHKEENPYLGYRMEVDLYAAVETLEKLTGQKFIHIEAMDDDERESWDANEDKNAALREEGIRAWEAEETKTTSRPEPYQRRAEPTRFVAARNAVRKLAQ